MFNPIDKDLIDPGINPFAGEPSAAAATDPSPRDRIPAADPWVFDPEDDADAATIAGIPAEKRKGWLNSQTHCYSKCSRCVARPCAQLKGHDPDLACSCKLALVNVECEKPHNIPKQDKFIGEEFIGTEEDLIEFMSGAIGGLLEADDSQFDNQERRLMPSCPQYPLGVETWPVGTPLFIIEIYSRFQIVAGQWDSIVEGIDRWYFDEVKLQQIAKLQLAANISKKKKAQRCLLRNLATASLVNQHKIIQFNKVGRGEEFRCENVAKEIADNVK